MFSERLFFNFSLYWWGFELAPARGSTASVGDYVMTSQDYIKVEHVRTSLPNSSFAKFQPFLSECFFHFFCQYLSAWLPGPYSIVAIRGRVFQ